MSCVISCCSNTWGMETNGWKEFATKRLFGQVFRHTLTIDMINDRGLTRQSLTMSTGMHYMCCAHFKSILIVNLLLFQTVGIAAEAHIACQVHAFQQSAPHIHLDVHAATKIDASEHSIMQSTECLLHQASHDGDATYYTSLKVFTELSTKLTGKYLNLPPATLHASCVVDSNQQYDRCCLVKLQLPKRCPSHRLHLLLQHFVI